MRSEPVVVACAVVAADVRGQASGLGVPLLLESGEPGPLVRARHDAAARANDK